MANANPAAHCAGDRGNACVLEGVFDYPPFNIVDASIFGSPTGSARANGRQPEPSGPSYSKSANPEFYLPTLI